MFKGGVKNNKLYHQINIIICANKNIFYDIKSQCMYHTFIVVKYDILSNYKTRQ